MDAATQRLRKISPEDIFLYQLSDGTLLDPPMPDSPFTEPDIHHLFSWSMHGRPFPGEGYFPVAEISEAVFATGFRGVTVMEVFDDDAFSKCSTLLAERANRAVGSWVRLSKELGLAPCESPRPGLPVFCTPLLTTSGSAQSARRLRRVRTSSARALSTSGTTSTTRSKVRSSSDFLGSDRQAHAQPQWADKLYACAAVGHQAIDLYEDDFLHYLSLQPGANKANLWEPIPAHLHAAKKIGDLCASLGMEIICFQPLIDVEGLVNQADREAAVERVKNYFPFMRALRTDCTYITTNRRYDFDNITGEVSVIAADLALFADLAADYARADGGPMIKIGYEHLSWGSHINTFDKTWEAIQLANRPNLGFVFDTFNFLAVEFADPYNPVGHGRKHDTLEESIRVVRSRLAKLVKLIPGDKIYVCQVADAKLVDPKSLKAPTHPDKAWTPDHEPPYRQWSSSHRLFPNESFLGGYMPVADCLAAILATVCSFYAPPLVLFRRNESPSLATGLPSLTSSFLTHPSLCRATRAPSRSKSSTTRSSRRAQTSWPSMRSARTLVLRHASRRQRVRLVPFAVSDCSCSRSTADVLPPRRDHSVLVAPRLTKQGRENCKIVCSSSCAWC